MLGDSCPISINFSFNLLCSRIQNQEISVLSVILCLDTFVLHFHHRCAAKKSVEMDIEFNPTNMYANNSELRSAYQRLVRQWSDQNGLLEICVLAVIVYEFPLSAYFDGLAHLIPFQ